MVARPHGPGLVRPAGASPMDSGPGLRHLPGLSKIRMAHKAQLRCLDPMTARRKRPFLEVLATVLTFVLAGAMTACRVFLVVVAILQLRLTVCGR